MMKLKSKRFCRGSFKLIRCGSNNSQNHQNQNYQKANCNANDEIKWEVRPGGMLVQRRDCGDSFAEFISVRISTLSIFHDVSVQPTSTFGELKGIIAIVTGLEPREQRLLFKGKEREDSEYLHMVGVKDKDKLFLLQDPTRLHVRPINPTPPCRTISV